MKRANKPNNEALTEMLHVIPTMDVVVFPRMIVPLLVLDEKIIGGIDRVMKSDSKMILLVASRKQLSSSTGTIGTKDLYDFGTVASIMRIIKIASGGVKILVQGHKKARISNISTDGELLSANVEILQDYDADTVSDFSQHIKNIRYIVERMSILGRGLGPDFHSIISKINDPEKVADFILSHLNLSVEKAQALLEISDLGLFLQELYLILEKECEISDMQENIKSQARDSMNQSQKEFYLREQLRAIKRELGEEDIDEIEKMREQLLQISLPKESYNEVSRQICRLEKTAPDSMEATVIRNYLDCVLALPWGKETVDNLDLKHAREILNEDHYGMEDIKERILDFISIKALRKESKTPILCLAGAPGIGKTSLGFSIARSLGREYMRVSLGGVKDEAEIRGHRRTYVGAMPGRFIQGMRKVQSCNPVIVIDEMDKICADFRGDPSAAMLELLDPQQNKAFYDNYLGIPFDLSNVMFIATANSLDSISEPLRDRMEIIELSSYVFEDKMEIAKRHLLKKSLADTGLDSYNFLISDELISIIIQRYTRESGVRELERVIRKLCSKATRIIVETGIVPVFTKDSVEQYLGPYKFSEDDRDTNSQIGICNGLAWTSVGGLLLKIEAVAMPGKGKLILTGQLGSVMQESAQAALSYARANATKFNIDSKIFSEYDLHIHLPAGAIPKDGPSAGVTLLTSILSVLTKRPVNADFAMTGELNLRGNIMPIGGVKEKILAAKRNGINNIFLPLKNKNDIVGLDRLIEGINLIWVGHAQEVLDQVLMPIGV